MIIIQIDLTEEGMSRTQNVIRYSEVPLFCDLTSEGNFFHIHANQFELIDTLELQRVVWHRSLCQVSPY